jgi:uncharacterized membrane protein
MSVSMQKGLSSFLSIHRIVGLTDGVFAIVMTLLVLEISIPEIAQSSVHTELPGRLIELWPKLLSYVISFIILGMFWYLHHIAFHYIKRSDNGLVWLNILFLMFIALIPFSTALFGSYGTEQLALVIYAINIILVSVMRFVIWIYATLKYRLVDNNISPSLLKWDRLISIGILFIFILMIGVSFINVAAARAVFILLGVLGLIMSIIARKIFAIS